MVNIGKNDKAAEFEKLYFENYTYLCKSVYRFVKDEEITKDIVQDVFLKYWQKIHDLRINESHVYYLRKSCINQAISFLKQITRRKQRENDYFTEITASVTASEQPDLKHEADETSKKIQQAIDKLPPACKMAFQLSRFEEKSYKEIASAMDISVNTVEKHIGKALRILRATLNSN